MLGLSLILILLPLYDNLNYQYQITKNCANQPWVVQAWTGSEYKSYVIKPFGSESKCPTMSEVLGSVLAPKFDLPVPEPALFKITNDFINTIPIPLRYPFLNIETDIVFGCELIQGSYRFDPTMKKGQLSRMIDIDTSFAFDQLICNGDRTNYKPNILLLGDYAYIIDHEKGFNITNKSIRYVKNQNLATQFAPYHIFHSYLANSITKTKRGYFIDFESQLRQIDFRFLDAYLGQLTELNVPIIEKKILYDYFSEIQTNSNDYLNLLRGTIL